MLMGLDRIGLDWIGYNTKNEERELQCVEKILK